MYRPPSDNQLKNVSIRGVFMIQVSVFYELTLIVSKVFHPNHKSKIIQYRDFDNASCRADLQ